MYTYHMITPQVILVPVKKWRRNIESCNLQAEQIDVLRRVANEYFGAVMTVSYGRDTMTAIT